MKKTTFLISVIIATMVTTQLNAQDSIFDLKSYKTTNYERSSLDVKFDLNEAGSIVNYERTRDSLKQNSSYSNSGLNLESDYSKIIYSKKRILNYGGTLYLNDNFVNTVSSNSDTSSSNSLKIHTFQGKGNNGISGYYSLNNYYSPSTKNYYLIGGNTSMGLTTQTFKIGESNENKTVDNYLNTTISFKLGHGHGRIEYVEDAVEAIYMLKELSENSLLSKKYSAMDIKALADKITLVKKERYFDERLYRQKSMKALVSLLEESGLISKGNIDIFNTISDYHYYAGINERPSGQKFEYYLTPGFSYNKDVAKSTYWDDDEVSNEYSGNLGLSLEYSNYKPISIKWQRNIYADIDMTYSKTRKKSSSSNISNTTNLYGRAQAGFSYGYYPSTRSYLSAGLNAQYKYTNDISVELLAKALYNLVSANLNVSGYYYLSQQLRLSGSFYLISNLENDKSVENDVTINWSKDQILHSSLAVALTYYLF